MTTPYTAVPGNVSSLPLIITEPQDGDPRNAALFTTPFGQLADFAEYYAEFAARMVCANWQKVAAAFSAGTINAIAAGDASLDRYVLAVGSAGNTALSITAGLSWPAVAAVGANAYLVAKCFNGLFFCAGVGGAMATGTTTTPTARTSNTANQINAIAWNGSTGSPVYVAVANAGDTIRSTDGTTWVKTTVGASNFLGVAFGAGLFVAVSADGHVQTSPTGTVWTDRGALLATNAPSFGDCLRFASGLFLMVTNTGAGAPNSYWSTDGIAWTGSAISLGGTVPAGGLAHNGRFWLVVGNQAAGSPPTYVTSFTGKTWVQRATPLATSGLTGTTYATNPVGMLTVAPNGAFITHALAGTEAALSLAAA